MYSIFFRVLLLWFTLSISLLADSGSRDLLERYKSTTNPQLRALLLKNLTARQRQKKFTRVYESRILAPSAPGTGLIAEDELNSSFVKSRDFLLQLAQERGYWDGRSLGSLTETADYLLLCHYLDWKNTQRIRGAIAYLKSRQNSDGSWDLSPGTTRGRFDATAHISLALEVHGIKADSPWIRSSHQYLESHGSLKKLRTLTKFWYCVNNRLSWNYMPPVPREILALSFVRKWTEKHLSSWMRFAAYTLSVVISKNRRESEKTSGLWKSIKDLVSKAFSGLDKKTLKIVEDYLSKQQGKDGNFWGTVSHTVYGLMALKDLGYATNSEPITRGMAFIEGLQVPDGEFWIQDPYRGPIWDTSFTLSSLAEAGLSPDHPIISRARKFLLDRQIVDVYGEWAKGKTQLPLPGGWAFELDNDLYPDNDDTAVAITAIMKNKSSTDSQRAEEAVLRGVQWLSFMQNKDGSWAAWDKNQATKRNGPYVVSNKGFFKDAIAHDFGTADLTGHVLEAYGSLGYLQDHPPVRKAVSYLRKEQMDFGGFWGRWGINYIYGTHGVLQGLGSIKLPADDPMVVRALTWLKSVQNEDGGFGESIESYWDPGLAGVGPSTPTQTGWALKGLYPTSVQRMKRFSGALTT
jgi:squalene-hopene/tetraprenyl-beta-curcumene cyclase